jgi:hypothetical protein
MLRERRLPAHMSFALVVAIAVMPLLPAGLAVGVESEDPQCTVWQETPWSGGRDAPFTADTLSAGATIADTAVGAAASRGADSRDEPPLLSPEEAAELDARLRSASPERIPQAQREATIPVAVHVITAEDGTGAVDDSVVRAQVDTLNHAFSGYYGGPDTGFRFALHTVTRTAHDGWFSSFATHEVEAKHRLRVGGPETLNIYTADLGGGLLGASTFPQYYEERPHRDGVILDYEVLPGGERSPFNLGHTATHETGHWLGLFHTFQNGCAHPGDYVEDTPYEREPARGCPLNRNSCPGKPGQDPVTNFMNYSDDSCMQEFTEGQADRMWQAWWGFRAGT